MDYERFLNRIGQRQQFPQYGSSFEKLANGSEVLSLAGGVPDSMAFPLRSGTLQLKNGIEVDIDESTMTSLQQYSNSQGFPPFVRWCEQFIMRYHDPPCMGKTGKTGTKITVTSGASESYTKIFELCVSEGDKVIVENPTYSAFLNFLFKLGAKPIDVKGDGLGMVPAELRKVMSAWRPEDANDPSSDIPKIMLVVPSSGNPSGATLPLARKREIYEIAREYNLLIIEDDPDYFLRFGGERDPSFLSLDTDSRVLRADSFSKIMSGGLRLGILSGPTALVEKVQASVDSTHEHCSNLAQVAALKILERWGKEGFEDHVRSVSEFYERQMNAMRRSAKKWLSGLAEWDTPAGGIFFWMRLTTIRDAKALITDGCAVHKVLLAPGSEFTPNRNAPNPYLRATYANITPDEIDLAMQRLAEMIKEKSETI